MMTKRYRDLEAVQFAPTAFGEVPALPEGAEWSELCLSHSSEIYLVRSGGGQGFSIHDIQGNKIALAPPEGRERFYNPMVQRFRDGRWLVVEARADPDEHNAFIFDPAGAFMRSFHAGDGIAAAVVDGRDRIWLGYYEEAIFDKAAAEQYSPQGLLRLDDEGKIEFSYNAEIDEPFIWDMRALTLDAEDRAWFCASQDYFLASVDGNKADQILPRSPMLEPRALSAGPAHIALFGTIPQRSMICVMERESRRVRLIQLRGGDGRTLNPRRIATYGDNAIALAGGRLYRLDHAALLGALGPWGEANSATVASAVQYQDEERAYRSRAVLIAGGPNAGPREVRDAERPPENPPRHDEDD